MKLNFLIFLLAISIGYINSLGEFLAICHFCHENTHDFIVHPCEPGVSHSHTYFGSTDVDAFSNFNTIKMSNTSCLPESDKSAYWVPSLYYNGNFIPPRDGIRVYYHLLYPDYGYAIQPLPLGLRIIARKFKWSCFGGNGASSTTNFVYCGSGDLELLVNFPDCWDGVRLDSSDHQSHMTYSQQGSCPNTHPKLVPRVQYKMRYPIPGLYPFFH